jgi:hypothetical protein
MPWDYSIYPELTNAQKECFGTIGETIYMIQLAERAILTCSKFVFGDSEKLLLDNFYNEQDADKKKTLGQLLSELGKRGEIHPQLEQILIGFRNKRNFFVHQIFLHADFGLHSDLAIKNTEKFLLDLQDDAWNVQNIFISCLLHWAKETGVYEHLPESFKNNKHLIQVGHKPFHLLFREKPKTKS